MGVEEYALTTREVQVLKSLALGKTNKDISMLLDLKQRTVTFHLENIFKKLKVTTRTQAVIKAISIGLADEAGVAGN